VIESIHVTTEKKTGLNAGTVIGGALGGLLGHQVGGGSGQTAATIAGAVGGAVVGTNVGNRNGDQMYRIKVKMDDGTRMIVTQKGSVAALRVGEQVKLVGDQVFPA